MDENLNAELAVLSACETARGKIHSGEGMLGLSWAFFVANCPAIVVSQWEVADESTAALMVEFYRQLKSALSDANTVSGQSPARITKAEALRQAQLALLQTEQWKHPFYWAPFILIGDWR
jgi:CHAT domain-containing protein